VAAFFTGCRLHSGQHIIMPLATRQVFGNVSCMSGDCLTGKSGTDKYWEGPYSRKRQVKINEAKAAHWLPLPPKCQLIRFLGFADAEHLGAAF